ncbi:uncharacterized protein LOC128809967 [Vidua macroura]|uniref:uncharacterized protein LOC128809967 n=1 Tax=Vidua macroura TaxID=187451 RepID=UPI0023A8F4C7|nr:uncharacterized protein LOC128809967 [Vidua macroura]
MEEPLSSGCAHSLPDAALDCTQEQESTRGRFRRAAQLVCKFIKSIRQEETISRGTGLREYSEVLKHETSAALLDLLVERGVFRPEQVPAMVRYIHQWLTANDSAEHRLDNTLLHLTKVQPNDAVMTLLRVAPSCDRFAVRTLKSLLCQKQYKDVVVSMERRCGWDTLLCADTHHYAVLECLDSSECGDSVVEVSSRYLQSECRERRRLALRALLELIDDPSMAEKMWRLTESLMDLLWDSDAEIAGLTLITLSFIFLHKSILISTPIALQLAKVLLPLFDHENSQVQLLSIKLFQDMMGFLEKGEKPLERPVHQSLLPLFFHCHDENQRVAEASRETLICVAEFLRRRDLEKLVKKEKLWIFANCLLAEDRSRAAEHLRRALPYLQSPQEPLREAAVRFMGMAGRSLRGQQGELQLISEALEGMANDISVSVGSLAIQSLCILKAEDQAPIPMFQRLRDQLRRAWKTRPRLSRLGCLGCWGSVEG